MKNGRKKSLKQIIIKAVDIPLPLEVNNLTHYSCGGTNAHIVRTGFMHFETRPSFIKRVEDMFGKRNVTVKKCRITIISNSV